MWRETVRKSCLIEKLLFSIKNLWRHPCGTWRRPCSRRRRYAHIGVADSSFGLCKWHLFKVILNYTRFIVPARSMEAAAGFVDVCAFITHQRVLLCSPQSLVCSSVCHHFLLRRRHRFPELSTQHDALEIDQSQLSHVLRRIFWENKNRSTCGDLKSSHFHLPSSTHVPVFLFFSKFP